MCTEKIEYVREDEGTWISIFIPKRWQKFLEEYTEYKGLIGEAKEKYILIELQSSVRDFIFAVLDSMRNSDPERWRYFVRKYDLEDDLRISSDRVYLPD
jgi:hypothetical protein